MPKWPSSMRTLLIPRQVASGSNDPFRGRFGSGAADSAMAATAASSVVADCMKRAFCIRAVHKTLSLYSVCVLICKHVSMLPQVEDVVWNVVVLFRSFQVTAVDLQTPIDRRLQTIEKQIVV